MAQRYRLTTWVAFADFFVALSVIAFGYYAFEKNRADAAAGALKQCAEQVNSIAPKDAKGNVIPVKKLLLDLAGDVRADLDSQGLKVAVNENTASIVLSEDFIQFPSGQFKITPGSKEELRLAKVAECLLRQKKHWLPMFVLSVQGHTDIENVTPNEFYASNLELSRLRAKEVERILARFGVQAPQFQVVSQGVGEFSPKQFGGCRETAGGRFRCPDGRFVTSADLASNRRIELRFGLFTGN